MQLARTCTTSLVDDPAGMGHCLLWHPTGHTYLSKPYNHNDPWPTQPHTRRGRNIFT